MKKILVLGGLLLAGAPVMAQSYKATPASEVTTSTAAPEGKMVVPVSPTLPGEEKLSARERVERDLLMPPRREKAAALQAANEEANASDATAAEDATDAPTVRTTRSSAVRRRR